MASHSSRDLTPHRRRSDCEEHGKKEDTLNSPLWARLPEPLTELILAKSPFLSLMRFRQVCKRWRDLILFSKDFPRCTSSQGCLVRFEGNSKFTAFNCSRGIWEAISLQFLQVNWCVCEILAVSDGGLLCFRAGGLLPLHRNEDCRFLVCNPLTKYSKRVQLPCVEGLTVTDQPRMPIPGPRGGTQFSIMLLLLVGMVVDRHTGDFKLVVGNFISGFEGTTLVYDSHADSWTKAADIPEDVLRHAVPRSQPTTLTCKGNIYFYFKGSQDRLLKYEVEVQAWSWVVLPQSQYETVQYVETSRNVIERNGEILLVTPVYVLRRVTDRIIQMTIQVFKLQDGLTWTLTNCLPFSRVQEEVPVGTQIDCLGQGDVMFFIRRNSNLYLDGPKKISIRKWFHNVATKSDIISDWVDYQGDKESPNFKIFTPSMLGRLT